MPPQPRRSANRAFPSSQNLNLDFAENILSHLTSSRSRHCMHLRTRTAIERWLLSSETRSWWCGSQPALTLLLVLLPWRASQRFQKPMVFFAPHLLTCCRWEDMGHRSYLTRCSSSLHYWWYNSIVVDISQVGKGWMISQKGSEVTMKTWAGPALLRALWALLSTSQNLAQSHPVASYPRGFGGHPAGVRNWGLGGRGGLLGFCGTPALCSPSPLLPLWDSLL